MKWSRTYILVVALAVACGGGGDDNVDEDLGPIDDSLSFAERVNWPGTDQAAGRVIPFIRGFGEGNPTAYWFLGFASRRTADSFWFCREGEQCPLDGNQRLNWDTLVGNPLFTRLPGQPEFSPFWQMWKVTVPADYEADAIKTTARLDRLANEGVVTVEPFIVDFGNLFGEEAGFQEVVLHCALVLTGTTLAENGETLPDGSGPMMTIPNRFGWNEGYKVEFVDFTVSDGVFAEAPDSENRPLMRSANIYIQWRDCNATPRPAICDLPGYAYVDKRPVSERGLGQDITGDNDPNDTNNTLGSVPCKQPELAEEKSYSPLWAVNNVQGTQSNQLAMIDTNADQAVSDIASAADIFAAMDNGLVLEPVPATEDSTGNPVPGNDGQVFFNCPNPVPVNYVPFPCSENP